MTVESTSATPQAVAGTDKATADWVIVMDSSCDVPEKVGKGGLDWLIAPLKIRVDDREFVDDADLDVAEMMAAIKAYPGETKTACPSVGEYAELFRRARNVVAVTISSQLSASYETALQARDLVLEEDPTRNIHVVDSRATSGRAVLIAEEAERLVAAGLPFDEIAKRLDEFRDNSMLVFSLASFDNLIKNGRMPKYQGMLGQILKMRPVAIAAPDGNIEVLDKPRGEKAMMRKMLERINEYKDMTGKPVIIAHSNAEEVALKVRDMLAATGMPSEIRVIPTRGLCSFYTDEGGFIVNY
jgi:DegV family protein with EDD domain